MPDSLGFSRHLKSKLNEKGNLKCVVPKISIPPAEGTFVLNSPLEFPFQGVLVISPPSPMNFCNFLNWLDTPGKNTFLKNAVALYLYAIDSGFCDKERKNLLNLC